MRDVRLTNLDEELADLSYPSTREAAMEALEDVQLRYADGEEPLIDVLQRSNADEFSSADELKSEVLGNAPTEAVGEPGQSEGEG